MERPRLTKALRLGATGLALAAALSTLAGLAALAGCENGMLTAIEKAVDRPPVWTLVAKRMAGTPEANANFGYSVDVEGQFVVAGGPNGTASTEMSSTPGAGMSDEFWQLQGGPDNWGKESGLEGPDPDSGEALAAGDMFGWSVAVATVGTTGHCLVGIPYDDVTSPAYTDSGKVFVKQRMSISGSWGSYWSWRPTDTLLASGRASNDNFGRAVALDGSTGTGRGIIGAPYKNSSEGRINIFEGAYSSWTLKANLTASDITSGDNYGYSVGISGDYAIVGAPSKNTDSYDEGGAYILFRDAGENWSQQAVLSGENDEPEKFGWSVAIDGDYAIVGAPQDGKLANSYAGAAHIFERSGTSWTHVARLEASDRTANDRFGTSVAISGAYAVVGAPYSGTDDSGAVYVFRHWREDWDQVAKLTPTDSTPAGDYFGTAVAIDGTTIVVGAPYDDEGASNAGAIYIFDAQ